MALSGRPGCSLGHGNASAKQGGIDPSRQGLLVHHAPADGCCRSSQRHATRRPACRGSAPRISNRPAATTFTDVRPASRSPATRWTTIKRHGAPASRPVGFPGASEPIATASDCTVSVRHACGERTLTRHWPITILQRFNPSAPRLWPIQLGQRLIPVNSTAGAPELGKPERRLSGDVSRTAATSRGLTYWLATSTATARANDTTR